jgi:hypothetical protein
MFKTCTGELPLPHLEYNLGFVTCKFPGILLCLTAFNLTLNMTKSRTHFTP